MKLLSFHLLLCNNNRWVNSFFFVYLVFIFQKCKLFAREFDSRKEEDEKMSVNKLMIQFGWFPSGWKKTTKSIVDNFPTANHLCLYDEFKMMLANIWICKMHCHYPCFQLKMPMKTRARPQNHCVRHPSPLAKERPKNKTK